MVFIRSRFHLMNTLTIKVNNAMWYRTQRSYTFLVLFLDIQLDIQAMMT